MATKAERKLIGGDSGRLTAIQRSALDALERSGPSEVWGLPDQTLDSLLARKLVDRIGRLKLKGRNKYTITDLGRTVLALRTKKTGRAKR